LLFSVGLKRIILGSTAASEQAVKCNIRVNKAKLYLLSVTITPKITNKQVNLNTYNRLSCGHVIPARFKRASSLAYLVDALAKQAPW
jgi:hypothetical protein